MIKTLILYFIKQIFNKSKGVQCCLYSYRQRYSSSRWSKCCGLTRCSQRRTAFDLFFTTIFNAKESVYFRGRPNSWYKERASVVYNFLAIRLVYFPKWGFLIGYYFAWQIDASMTRQGCPDSYRQRPIRQSDCEITSNCGKNYIFCRAYV